VTVPALASYGFTFSSCVKAGDFIYTPHHAGFLDEEGNVIESIEAQTQQGLKNLGKALNAAGVSLDDVVKTMVLLRNPEDFKGMRAVYRRYFSKGFPARTGIVGTDLLDSACLRQIDAVAYRPTMLTESLYNRVS
jgi:2-iminobutanoate/2-iminopropanoate deaminase